MTGSSSGQAGPIPPPDLLLAALEPDGASGERVAQLRHDVLSIHDVPLDVGVEPLPGVRFEGELRPSTGG